MIALAAVCAGVWGTASAAQADSAMAWGFNSVGQLGNGSTTDSNVPVEVTGLHSGVSTIAVGRTYSLAIQNGAAKSWGYNANGELGNGLTANSSVPVNVTGLSSGVTAVAGGYFHSLAIQNGAALSWGSGVTGQLGNGYSSSKVPLNVTGLSSGVTAIAAGDYHSLAIQNGAVKSWGDNEYGQLGDGTYVRRNAPVSVVGLSSGVTAIAAGYLHNLAIQNGALKVWGYNTDGQFGTGPGSYVSNIAVGVTDLSSGVTAIAAGSRHSLAIKNGNVYAFGSDSYGALGNGPSPVDSDVPIMVLDLPDDLIAVEAGYESSYALCADGTLWAWGCNTSGQNGLGTTTYYQESPAQVLAPEGYKFTSIDAVPSSYHVVATIALVPEPTTLGLIGLGGLMLLRRRSK